MRDDWGMTPYLPVHPSMTEPDVGEIVRRVHEIAKECNVESREVFTLLRDMGHPTLSSWSKVVLLPTEYAALKTTLRWGWTRGR